MSTKANIKNIEGKTNSDISESTQVLILTRFETKVLKSWPAASLER